MRRGGARDGGAEVREGVIPNILLWFNYGVTMAFGKDLSTGARSGGRLRLLWLLVSVRVVTIHFLTLKVRLKAVAAGRRGGRVCELASAGGRGLCLGRGSVCRG